MWLELLAPELWNSFQYGFNAIADFIVTLPAKLSTFISVLPAPLDGQTIVFTTLLLALTIIKWIT